MSHIKVETDLGKLFYLSYLSALIVLSEAVRPTRVFAGDPIAQFIPQNDKAQLAVRNYDQAPVLVDIFAFGKNVKYGRILATISPHLRASRGKPTQFPKSAGFGPYIKHRASTGGPPFSDWVANRFNRTINAPMADRASGQGGEYPPPTHPPNPRAPMGGHDRN